MRSAKASSASDGAGSAKGGGNEACPRADLLEHDQDDEDREPHEAAGLQHEAAAPEMHRLGVRIRGMGRAGTAA